jgi:GntR family transcriptional repressor for pyruvate dehydrogenase complex
MRVKRIERTSASDEVRTQLLELIQGGELPVGAKLPSEHALAQSFGVSRTVIREGLGTLRSIGLVESRAGAGTFVRSTNAARGGLLLAGRHSSAELHEVRCHIEIPGAGLAAARRTDEHLRQLDEILERHAEALDADAWVRDDLRFHATLAEATGNPLQVRFVTELHELQSELSLTMARMTGGLAAPLTEHAAIVEAVRHQDDEGARAAMTAHLAAIQKRSEALEA